MSLLVSEKAALRHQPFAADLAAALVEGDWVPKAGRSVLLRGRWRSW